jgi:hypothetical protein
MKPILLEQAKIASFLRHPMNAKEFTVEFIKRSTLEIRVMKATTRYEEHLKGGTLPYDTVEKGLLPVWDLEKEAFRSIPLDSVVIIKVKGKTYTIQD